MFLANSIIVPFAVFLKILHQQNLTSAFCCVLSFTPRHQLILMLNKYTFWFRCYLSPNKDRKNIRHVVATTLGTLFGIFCFGWYSLHFFILVSVCYVIMVKAGVDNIHRFSLVTALGYLSICQISRVYIFDYGLLSTDFSG
uniref:Membrane bound O-acyltransferase domain containing 1 n=1 Tax=Erpetoichthys calabaricus TaxID=27687 RepID=A0A8C4T3J0_ERPCA